ncbi:MAG: molybdate ABC transporter substrate-binding protein [Desulfuromonas sp.]|nr:MAG: molybdate ABC transporter substrate-binding protein [Desulfuromonas sp.]
MPAANGMNLFSTNTFNLLLLSLILLITGCDESASVRENQPELLIYCGITMIQPIREIADIIENNHHCRIKISKGGSGNLLRSIELNRVGDLYFPGADSYIRAAEKKGFVSESRVVGANRATIVVAKGNPLKITGVEDLIRPELRVVLGSPDSGSIGRETKRILEQSGLYEKVWDKVVDITTDSKDLAKALREGKADVAINWHATVFMPENAQAMEAIQLPEDKARPAPLVLGLLSFSETPELARNFMNYAASAKGQEIFTKYGFAK